MESAENKNWDITCRSVGAQNFAHGESLDVGQHDVGSVLHSLRVVLAKKVRTDPAPAVTDAIQLQACVQADLDYIKQL